MTSAEHAQQKALVLASELLQPTRTQRHDVYPARRRRVPARPRHVYVLPTVVERRLL